jgi:hypothetical protein
MSILRYPTRWLVLGAFILLTPAFLIAGPQRNPEPSRGCGGDHYDRGKKCTPVPDGGESASYLLAAGATCLGAMFIGSRIRSGRLS